MCLAIPHRVERCFAHGSPDLIVVATFDDAVRIALAAPVSRGEPSTTKHAHCHNARTVAVVVVVSVIIVTVLLVAMGMTEVAQPMR